MFYQYETNCATKNPETETRELFRTPAVDILESKDKFSLTLNMPGITKEDVKINIENDELVITGQAKTPDTTDKRYVLKEIRRGNYVRKFKISDAIDRENIQAVYENGVLSLELSKKPEVQPRSIEIK